LELADDIAAWGGERPEVQTEFEVWPENWDAVQLFTACATQWRVAMGGVTGLDYTAVLAMAPLYADKPDKDLMERVRVCEGAVLAELKRERERDGETAG
jgi:hypothetical protein